MKPTLLALLAVLLPGAALARPTSVAVAFDGKSLHPVLAEGEADRATHRAVTPDDPVRIASISKLVSALGVMRLVDQGKLDLDRDVSDYLGWPLRHPGYPERPITLRLLLSHQSGLIDGDDLYLIPLGTSLRERLADPKVWDMAHAPGSGWFHYTNLNFPVVASVMERAGGDRFDRLMTRLVLKPLKLDACFNWSGCSAKSAARAVVLYRSSGETAKDDLKGRLPDCPVLTQPGDPCDLASYRLGENGALFSPQGGLRISMRGLARIGQLLVRQGHGFISPGAYGELTTARWRFDGSNGVGEDGVASGFFCAYGLAVQRIGSRGEHCRDDLFGDGIARTGHAGDAYGLKAGLWWDPVSGRGLAFFTSAVPPDSPGKHSAFSAAEEEVVERAATRPFR